MQLSSKLLFRTAIVLLGVMLAMVVFVAINSNQQAQALSGTEWQKVRGYIDSYYGGSQSGGGLNGEAGFRMGKVDLWNRLDSTGDIQPNAGAGVAALAGVTVTGALSEGDDMALRPVLIDNLMGRTDIIPGTEFRCNWNTDESCFSDSSISAIRQIVDNHQAAGFSTDIVDYCVSSQTAGPTTAGFGIIAQVPGALASDTGLIPNVYIADYSRNGWRNNLSNAPGANGTTAPEAATTVPNAEPGTVANCDGLAPDYELVRCQANWAMASNLGNVGNGSTSIAAIGAADQSVDVRSGSINTMASAGVNMQVPIDTLFSIAGLQNLDPFKSTVLTGRTQMGSTSTLGLKMLGYNLIAGGSINGGIHRWDATEGEQQVAYGDGLPVQSIASFTSPGTVDTTGPTVTSVGSSAVTTNSANIDRVAGEPATMKVEYGTTAGGPYTSTVNNTVLNASKTVSLGSLSGGTTYYYKVTSYDGYANGTVSAEGSFTTVSACSPAKPSLSLSAPAPFWASPADYTARHLSVTWTISNTGANGATNVAITGSTNNNDVTIVAGQLPATVGTGSIGAGSSGNVTLKYYVPVSTGSWHTSTTASADDDCGGTGYTYP